MSDWVDIGPYFLHANSHHYPFGEPHNLGEPMGGFYTDDITYQALQWECDHTLWPAGNTISQIKIVVTNRSSFTATDWIWCFYGGEYVDWVHQFEACDTTSDLEFILDLGGQCDPTVYANGSYGIFWMHCDFCGSYGTNFTITSVEAQGEGSLFAPATPARLFRHTGRTVEYTYTAPPPPPYTPPPPATSSPTPTIPSGSSNPPVSNVTPPSPPPNNQPSGWSNVTMVPCSPSNPNVDEPYMGESRFSVWEVGPNGSLIRQISPCM